MAARERRMASKLIILSILLLLIQVFGAAAQLFSSSSSFIKVRANKLRRPDLCRENLPRKSEELPALVITGRVKEVYLAGDNTFGSLPPSSGAANSNRALVTVKRVIKGNQDLLDSELLVSGFNSSAPGSVCPNYVKPNDTYILLLRQEADRKYAIQNNNILSMNLNNLDRINAIANDEPLKRRPLIEDILCEAHYCAYGRCVVLNERSGSVACQCPESCPPLPAPVCGSDNTTYSNECLLIQEGCRRKRPLFVTKESPCT